MLADQFERQRFIQEIQSNFSVLAPAGVGKTQAIVDRLVYLAQSWGNHPKGKIAIVTYTQKAAAEMQERVEAALKSLPDRGRHFKAIAFFGTIHSLALMLLEQYGSVSGLPLQLKLLEDPQSMWESFCMQLSQETILKEIPFWESAAPLISIREALKHCQSLNTDLPSPPSLSKAPNIDWQALDNWVPEKPTLKRGVESTLKELKAFAEAYEKGLPCLTLPIPTKGGEAFIQAVEELLKPLRDFAAKTWHHLLYQLQKHYQAYRHHRGQLTYDDMIHLALKIVDCPEIQQANFHVLLDEAQDTDTKQLLFLQKLAGLDKISEEEDLEIQSNDAIRSLHSTPPPQSLRKLLQSDEVLGAFESTDRSVFDIREDLEIQSNDAIRSLHSTTNPRSLRKLLQSDEVLGAFESKDRSVFDIREDLEIQSNDAIRSLQEFTKRSNGRFVLVGDPQQSIYGMRAHLATYLRLHENLVKKQLAEELRFRVTFRCDSALIEVINQVGEGLLKPSMRHEKIQVAFQPLRARPNATEGHIERLKLEVDESVEEAEIHEAKLIANFLNTEEFRSRANLSNIAILCPRNEWLQTIAEALAKNGIPYQLHARGKIHRERVVFSWTLGLLKSFYQPQEAFETVGILREIFGISDALLAEWVELSLRNASQYIHPLSFLNSVNALDVSKQFLPLYNALQLLKEAQEASLCLGPRAALEVIYEMLNLRARLKALNLLDTEDELEYLQNLLLEASGYECEGKTLYDFLRTLEIRKYKPLEAKGIEENKIQLLSSHSAKGLEWETVIIPYFFRPIGYKVQSYPQWLSFGSTHAFRWDAAHKIQPLESWISEDRKAQQERLLYVTLTRAKHELYLADDSSLWKKTHFSFAETLHIQEGESSRSIWENIPQRRLEDSSSAPLPTENEISFPVSSIPLSPEKWSNYPKRHLPSQSIDDNPIPKSSHIQQSNSGTEYGNTWHEMMASCPWSRGYHAWGTHCKNWTSQFVDIERAKTEIDIFLQSKLIPILEEFAPFIRTEVPFIWQESATALYEGSIDLLAYDPDRQEGWILDWKTNRSTSMNDLKNLYIKQISAYQAALKSRYRDGIIKKILYSTPTGDFLIENKL